MRTKANPSAIPMPTPSPGLMVLWWPPSSSALLVCGLGEDVAVRFLLAVGTSVAAVAFIDDLVNVIPAEVVCNCVSECYV